MEERLAHWLYNARQKGLSHVIRQQHAKRPYRHCIDQSKRQHRQLVVGLSLQHKRYAVATALVAILRLETQIDHNAIDELAKLIIAHFSWIELWTLELQRYKMRPKAHAHTQRQFVIFKAVAEPLHKAILGN
jgi:hypothetical protein